MAALTTYLSVLALRNKMTQAALEMKRLPKTVLYVYDAFLTQCAYVSRLAYDPPAILIDGLKDAMNGSAAVKNASIEQLERVLVEKGPETDKLFITGIPPGEDMCSKGIYIPTCGCSIIQYVNSDTTNIVNNSRTLYVIFKGTSTMEELNGLLEVEFANAKSAPISSLGEKVAAAKGECYSILIDKYKPYINTILDAVQKYSEGVDQIIVTGHSVGGSAATLFGYLIKLLISTLPIHIVSFGALRPFDKTAATAFNGLLEYGKFTYDNILGINEEFANYPKALVFPGKEVPANIGDVRVQFGQDFEGIEQVDSIYYNAPFTDPEKHAIMKDVYKSVVVEQQGGAPTPKTPDDAKKITEIRSANTILYECTDDAICHGNYMGISFMNVWDLDAAPADLGILEYVMLNGKLYTIHEKSMPTPTRAITVPLPVQPAAAPQTTRVEVVSLPMPVQPIAQSQGGGRRKVKITRKARFIRARKLRAVTRALRLAGKRADRRV
jgi:hypothetical protein